MTDERMGLDEYFMRVARLVSRRSTCIRRPVGAIVVKNKRILTTGYNGAPRNLRHCMEVGCIRDELGIRSGNGTSSAEASTPSRTPSSRRRCSERPSREGLSTPPRSRV